MSNIYVVSYSHIELHKFHHSRHKTAREMKITERNEHDMSKAKQRRSLGSSVLGFISDPFAQMKDKE